MRTALEIATQLDELLKRSKPFRNFNEAFKLTEELLSTLSFTEEVIEEIIEEPTPTIPEVTEFSIMDIIEEPVVEETPVVEAPVVAKKTTKKK